MVKIPRTNNQQRERTIDEFVKELRISGRYFVGNPSRQEYIQDHKTELDNYLNTLRAENWRDADHIELLIRINSKPAPKRQIDLNEMMETRENILNKTQRVKEERITMYNPYIRKKVERYISAAIMIAAIPLSAYVGMKFKTQIEKIIEPYTQRIFQAYNGEFR